MGLSGPVEVFHNYSMLKAMLNNEKYLMSHPFLEQHFTVVCRKVFLKKKGKKFNQAVLIGPCPAGF